MKQVCRYKEEQKRCQVFAVQIVRRMRSCWITPCFRRPWISIFDKLDPIPAPRYFLKEIPLTDEMSDLVLKSRQEIRDVLNGKDDRLLAIVGPCSIHDPKAAHEYAAKLAAVKKNWKTNWSL